MNDARLQVAHDDTEPVLSKRRRISLIWIIPIVAAAIAAWLGYKTLSEKGPSITISFATAEGLEAGKTRIKHKDVELGLVQTVTLAPDLSRVLVTAQMQAGSEPHLTQGTRFWVVRPRLGISGISGLGALASGSHIEMDPGKGSAVRRFTGLEEPPVVLSDVRGQTYVLKAARIGALSAGSPVYFRDVHVGEVLGSELTDPADGFTIRVFVRAPYDRFVHNRSRFWNASGITVGAGPSGFKVQVESLLAVLAGAVAFDTAPGAAPDEQSPADTVFRLFDDAESVREAQYVRRVPFLIEFDGSVRGLEVGAPVEIRGMRMGTVTDVHLAFDSATNSVRVPVTIELEPGRVVVIGDGPAPAVQEGYPIMNQLVARGLRAQLRSGNLLTGELYVALDFFPDAEPAKITVEDGRPKLPSVPTDLESITRSVSQTLERFASLPLDEVLQDVRNTLQSVQSVVNSPDIVGSLRSLNATLDSAEKLSKNADRQMGPLLNTLRQAATAAQGTLKQADTTLAGADASFGFDSRLQRDILGVMSELKDAARSIRLLAEYVEQHPEALLRGKSTGGQ
jgi:paraquat-inducible protein B